jgi:hypothetical protein
VIAGELEAFAASREAEAVKHDPAFGRDKRPSIPGGAEDEALGGRGADVPVVGYLDCKGWES